MTLSESLTEQAFEVFEAEMQRLFRMSPHAEPGDVMDAQRSAVAAVVQFAQAERMRECPECEGKTMMGWLTPPCPRCGGSGVERMVALAEVLEALRGKYDDPYVADFIEHRFGGGER